MNPSKCFSNSSSIDALYYVISHPGYKDYVEYLEVWHEELVECPEDRAIEISKMFGLPYVGHGDRRVCLHYQDFVIKLPLESCYWESNEKEYELFNKLKDTKSKLLNYLCPILEYEDGIIVTPYCEEFKFHSRVDFYSKSTNIISKFKEEGIMLKDMESNFQFGDCNGQLKIFDYEDYEFYDLEVKNPSDMYKNPVHIGQCPLCRSNVYSEDNTSEDLAISRTCCNCKWSDNQFLTHKELNSIIGKFSNS